MQMTLQSTFILHRVVTCPMFLIKGSLQNLFFFFFPDLLANVYYFQIFTVFSIKLQLESQTAAENSGTQGKKLQTNKRHRWKQGISHPMWPKAGKLLIVFLPSTTVSQCVRLHFKKINYVLQCSKTNHNLSMHTPTAFRE